MSRHDQKPRENKYTCTRCRDYECDQCIDVTRAKLFGENVQRVCVCQHKDYLAAHPVTDDEIIESIIGGVPNERVEKMVHDIAGSNAKD